MLAVEGQSTQQAKARQDSEQDLLQSQGLAAVLFGFEQQEARNRQIQTGCAERKHEQVHEDKRGES